MKCVDSLAERLVFDIDFVQVVIQRRYFAADCLDLFQFASQVVAFDEDSERMDPVRYCVDVKKSMLTVDCHLLRRVDTPAKALFDS